MYNIVIDLFLSFSYSFSFQFKGFYNLRELIRNYLIITLKNDLLTHYDQAVLNAK